ncbi:MAG TPA: CPBP family intramembrane glutamic endopeptidase [bacterium]|nr:CPBP family intramembrane glutamic endopeptidase [bacterium]
MTQLLARRWPTLLLLLWLPLVKWSLPAGWLRLLLFFVGGCALAGFAVWKEGDWPRLQPLFARPWRGLAIGLGVYALLVVVALGLLIVPGIFRLLPLPLYALVSMFDPRPVVHTLAMGGPLPSAVAVAVFGLGSVAEEWMFRTVLFWRWLPARDTDGPRRVFSHPGAQARLVVVSVYFAALHWPQPPGAMLVALLGSLVLGNLLLWARNFTQVALLHVLFNWRLLL